MHVEVQEFCLSVKKKFPTWPHPSPFHRARVLDCGSLDINGNNRYLFTECDYTGIDLVDGPNVRPVMSVKEYYEFFYGERETFDTIVSTEMLEHDRDWQASIRCMYEMLKPGGLLIITCATGDRPEHGTADRCPDDSPLTNDYYKNISETEFQKAINDMPFSDYQIQIARDNRDLYFWGVKAQ